MVLLLAEIWTRTLFGALQDHGEYVRKAVSMLLKNFVFDGIVSTRTNTKEKCLLVRSLIQSAREWIVFLILA